MSNIIMVTGGSRSGKSQYAEELCLSRGSKLAYIATAHIYDSEMELRVQTHKERRGDQWSNFELPLDIESHITELNQFDYILIDCLTMLVLNKMFSYGYNLDDDANITKDIYITIEKETLIFINQYMNQISKLNGNVIVVTNEIGLGIIPESKLNRLYSDIVGKANQILAEKANEVFFVVSGLPMKIKDKK